MAKVQRRIASRLVVIEDDLRQKVLEVLERTPYYAGPETAAFEKEVADYCGVPHGVAANSGTSCLLLALLAQWNRVEDGGLDAALLQVGFQLVTPPRVE